MNKAPERIELPGGQVWLEKEDTGYWWLRGRFETPLDGFDDDDAVGFAAAMQPQVSESDEAVTRVVEHGHYLCEGWRSFKKAQNELHEAQENDIGTDDFHQGLEEVVSDCWAGMDNRVHEFEKRVAQLARHRQPAAVSADAVEQGIIAKVLAHAIKLESTWEFERLAQLLPQDNQAVQDAIAIRKWADQKEPKGAKVMGGDLGSLRQKEHNKSEFDRCEEGKTYLCYDHYRNAFWGPNRGGYCYRRSAGHYDKKGVGEVILGSNRYFTVEEVPANIVAALRRACGGE